MPEQLINAGILKEKEELEFKLTKEISSKFGVSEALARKMIYETHLDLDGLKNEILKDRKLNDKLDRPDLTKEQLQDLLKSLKNSKELIENLSKSERQELIKILEHKDIQNLNKIVGDNNKILQKILGKKLINKAKKPQNIGEHIMGISLGIINSTVIIGELIFSFGIGIIKAPTDLLAIFIKKAEIDSFKRI